MSTVQEIILRVSALVAGLVIAIGILSAINNSLSQMALGILKNFLNAALRVLAIAVGLIGGISISPYKPALDFSKPQLVTIISADSLQAGAIPSNAIPSNAIPSNAIPSNGIPSNSLPAEAIPANAIPSNAIPSNVMFKRMEVYSPPDFGEVACKGKTCPDGTEYTYYSDQTGVELAQPPAAEVNAEIWADAYSLTKGECTTLHWAVSGADQVFFQDTEVLPGGNQLVCPQETTSYTVNASNAGGNRGGAVLAIRVEEPQPQPATGAEQAPNPDRCVYFEGINMSVVYMDWLAGSPLQFYVKMPGGVPGLEKQIPGMTGNWTYTAKIGDYTASECSFIQGYKDRLYCSISLPEWYSNSMQAMTLTVNQCDQNVYHNKTAFLPGIEGGSAGGDGDEDDSGDGGTGGSDVCGPEPADDSTPQWSDWCSCRHDNSLGC